jgi:hypothetical protein
MKTTLEKQHGRQLKRFHTLCSQLGMSDEEKRALVLSFGVGSSRDMTAAELRYTCERMEESLRPEAREMNVWRKRLIAAIGGWLRKMNRTGNIRIIKAVACRASGRDDFNRIPLQQLVSLYNAFIKKSRDMEMVEFLTAEDLDGLALMN